jgi:hypothetical protein
MDNIINLQMTTNHFKYYNLLIQQAGELSIFESLEAVIELVNRAGRRE